MSFGLSESDIAKLGLVHPDLSKVVYTAASYTSAPFVVEQGLRTEAEQAQVLSSGHSRTMKSKHLRQPDGWGHAVDLVPVINGILLWQLPPPHQWDFIWPLAAAMQRAAGEAQCPIRWGGDWRHELGELAPGPEGLQRASQSYTQWFHQQYPHESVFLDGVHFELAA